MDDDRLLHDFTEDHEGITRFGFIYGRLHVERIAKNPEGYVSVYLTSLESKGGLFVSCSPKGKLLRVHDANPREWGPVDGC